MTFIVAKLLAILPGRNLSTDLCKQAQALAPAHTTQQSESSS